MTGHAGTRGRFRFVRRRGHPARLCVRRVADHRPQVATARNRQVVAIDHSLREAAIARNRRVVAIDLSPREAAIARNRQVVATGHSLRVAAAIVRLRRVAITTGRRRTRDLRLVRTSRATTETTITTATEFGSVNACAAPRCLGHRGAVVFVRRI